MILRLSFFLKCKWICLLLVLASQAHAQGDSMVVKETDTFSKYRLHKLWEIGISANAYKGDLSDTYRLWSSALHLGLKFAKKKRWNTHLGLSVGSVRGENFFYEYEQDILATPNKFFKTGIVAFQFDVQYNFVRKKHWIAYISQGIGLLRYIPKNEQGKSFQNQFASRAIDEAYNSIAATFPSSVGVLHLLPNGYGIGMIFCLLRPATDYIDNIGLWGNQAKADKILMVKFHISVPAWKIRTFFWKDAHKERSTSR